MPLSDAGKSLADSRASALAGESKRFTELSVAMKRVSLLFVLLLALPTLAPAQTQTTGRRSSDRDLSPQNESTAVRNRVVGSARAANRYEKQKLSTEAKNQDSPAPVPDKSSRSLSLTSQDVAQRTWGNTSVLIRPTATERNTPVNGSAINSSAVASQNNGTSKELVQQTALAIEAPLVVSPILGKSNSRTPASARAVASMGTYHVGIGDVLDIRLANLPTRESTLFTVLKNGVVEYPLLNGPISVAGLTTDEIARLLSKEIRVIQAARVSVSVRDYASHAVVVTGLVDSPGRKTLRREAMPLYAVLAEALPRPEASVATIVRPGKEEAVSLNNEDAMSTLVLPGDVIRITGAAATAKRFVYVGGDVASPGEREFRDGMTLTQALLSAGGVFHPAKTSVRVARRNANGFLRATDYNLLSIEEGKSQDPVLEAGDRIEVKRRI